MGLYAATTDHVSEKHAETDALIQASAASNLSLVVISGKDLGKILLLVPRASRTCVSRKSRSRSSATLLGQANGVVGRLKCKQSLQWNELERSCRKLQHLIYHLAGQI